jgi:beta-lactamase class A
MTHDGQEGEPMAGKRSASEAQQELERLVAGVDGSVGVAAWPVGKPDQAIGVNMDELYPTASTFKIPLIYALYQMTDRDEISLSTRVTIEESDRVPGSGVLQDLDPGHSPTIRDLAVFMTVVSDNEATDLLYNIVGSTRIHAALDALQLTRTRVPMNTRALLYDYVGLDANNPEHTYDESLRRMRADEYNYEGAAWSDKEGSGNDLTTPREMTSLCDAIEQGVGLSSSAREGIIDIMKRQKFNDRIPAGVPEKIEIAHKTGSIKGVRNDAGIVYAPNGPYVIGVFSKKLADEKAGVACLAELSRVVWETFGAE